MGKVVEFERKKRIQINIGMMFFLVVFIYVLIFVFMYFSSKQIVGYQVKTGSLSVTNIYEGIALRDETIVTAGSAGYVNYFATEGEKVGTGNLVCCIDETGAIQDYISKNSADENNRLDDKDLLSLKNEMVNFSTAFDLHDFSTVYDFKYSLQGDVLKFANRQILNSIDELKAKSSLLKMCNSPASGVVIYSIDGFENKVATNVEESWFDKEAYEQNKTLLINNKIVSISDPLFKLSDNENWSIIIKVEKGRAQELADEKYIKVKFLKNQYESWGKVTQITGLDDNEYIQLSFTNSMINFVTDRFINVELLLNAETGLKIPNSAICEKAFYRVPEGYIGKGSDGETDGVLRQTYLEDGQVVPMFVPVTLYGKDGDTPFVYLDDSVLRNGDVLCKENSIDTFTLNDQCTGTLQGVYNINKGYADFKKIIILNSNEEYSIVESGTQYGLMAYDYIVLDADSVETDDLIYE